MIVLSSETVHRILKLVIWLGMLQITLTARERVHNLHTIFQGTSVDDNLLYQSKRLTMHNNTLRQFLTAAASK